MEVRGERLALIVREREEDLDEMHSGATRQAFGGSSGRAIPALVILNLFQHPGASRLAGGDLDPETSSG
jgi:hypothetical protein